MKLMIKNCVVEGSHPDGSPGNLAYSVLHPSTASAQ